MSDKKQLVWLVTGCSSGLGEILVKQILSRGDRVIATARRLESISHLQQTGAHILRLDVTESQKQIDETMHQAISVYGQIDVLVNNAGYILGGGWEDIEHEQLLAQFQTNVFGVHKVTRAILPHLRKRRSGTLVFISSLAGWYGNGFSGAYCGSKFALEGLVESLSEETQPLGIDCVLVEPGRFRTKLLDPTNLSMDVSKIEDYAPLSKAFAEDLASSNMTQPGDPERGVELILDFVRKEGSAAGKELPLRLPLGTDAYETLQRKCQQTLKVLEDWKSVTQSTDY